MELGEDGKYALENVNGNVMVKKGNDSHGEFKVDSSYYCVSIIT